MTCGWVAPSAGISFPCFPSFDFQASVDFFPFWFACRHRVRICDSASAAQGRTGHTWSCRLPDPTLPLLASLLSSVASSAWRPSLPASHRRALREVLSGAAAAEDLYARLGPRATAVAVAVAARVRSRGFAIFQANAHNKPNNQTNLPSSHARARNSICPFPTFQNETLYPQRGLFLIKFQLTPTS
jgi:hypothetical protein